MIEDLDPTENLTFEENSGDIAADDCLPKISFHAMSGTNHP